MASKGCNKTRNAKVKRHVPSTTFPSSALALALAEEDKCSLNGKGKQVRSTEVGSIYQKPKRPSVKVQNRRLRNNPDVVEEHEGSCKDYATMALNRYVVKNFELVETGPIGIGYISQGHVLHLNFKAKNKDGPNDNDAVNTFFCELIKTNANDVNLVCVSCLGPSSKLPDKAKTVGCLYCSDNIHHPVGKFMNSYRNGREEHDRFLFNRIKSLRNHIRKCELSPSFSHPGVMYFGTPFKDSKSLYATVALCLFNKTKDTNFGLVKLGSWGRSQLTNIGIITHINFNAKNLDDPNAVELTFFAEVIRNMTFLFAAFCDCLGPSNLLTEKTEPHGCCYCARRTLHPPGPGYINGREYCRDFDQ